MSFFSSLILFYPGKPPIMRGRDLHVMAKTLRDSVGVKSESRCSLNLKWGERIDQDYESTNEIDWDESGLMGTLREYPWDVKRSNVLWNELWPESGVAQTIYRAFVSLGYLTKDACESLGAAHPASDHRYIAPDSISINIDPICPSTLSSEESVCTGLVSVGFGGNGYFTWGRSMLDYASQYSTAQPVSAARRICREHYPVIRDDRFERIADHLGDLFLNRSYYVEGDWILTIVESG